MTTTEIEKVLLDKILAIEPKAYVTYYHPTIHSGGWRVHKWGHDLSKMYEHKIDALTEALNNLQMEC